MLSAARISGRPSVMRRGVPSDSPTRMPVARSATVSFSAGRRRAASYLGFVSPSPYLPSLAPYIAASISAAFEPGVDQWHMSIMFDLCDASK